MSFAQDNGYTPVDFAAMIDSIRVNVNSQFGTTYTEESFVGTGWYKYAYAIVQKMQENEVKTSEIFLKLQEYIATTNEQILRPTVSHPGLFDAFATEGFLVSIKPPLEADAGKIFICIDLDDGAMDYADKKLEAATLIKDFVAAGIQSQGSEVETIVLSNGQAFDFKFNLPVRTPIILRFTATISENNMLNVPTDEQIRLLIFNNINARYRLGLNFEPQRYITLSEAAWASNLLLEWSDDDGANWNDTVFDSLYTDVLEFALGDIEVVLT